MLDELALDAIDSVTFYKRDELTTDLICCDVRIGDRSCFFHEEAEGWDMLLHHLEKLPGFRGNWYAAVAKPAFARCATLAYQREGRTVCRPK